MAPHRRPTQSSIECPSCAARIASHAAKCSAGMLAGTICARTGEVLLYQPLAAQLPVQFLTGSPKSGRLSRSPQALPLVDGRSMPGSPDARAPCCDPTMLWALEKCYFTAGFDSMAERNPGLRDNSSLAEVHAAALRSMGREQAAKPPARGATLSVQQTACAPAVPLRSAPASSSPATLRAPPAHGTRCRYTGIPRAPPGVLRRSAGATAPRSGHR